MRCARSALRGTIEPQVFELWLCLQEMDQTVVDVGDADTELTERERRTLKKLKRWSGRREYEAERRQVGRLHQNLIDKSKLSVIKGFVVGIEYEAADKELRVSSIILGIHCSEEAPEIFYCWVKCCVGVEERLRELAELLRRQEEVPKSLFTPHVFEDQAESLVRKSRLHSCSQ